MYKQYRKYLYIFILGLCRLFGDKRITTIVIQNETRKLLKQIGKKRLQRVYWDEGIGD